MTSNTPSSINTYDNNDPNSNIMIFDRATTMWGGRGSELHDKDKRSEANTTNITTTAVARRPRHDEDDDLLLVDAVGGVDEGDEDASDNWGPLPWMGHHLQQYATNAAAASYDYYYFSDNSTSAVDVINFDCEQEEGGEKYDGAADLDSAAFFGLFARSNYMESIRTWTCSSSSGDGTTAANSPPQPLNAVIARPPSSSRSMSMDIKSTVTDEEEDDNEDFLIPDKKDGGDDDDDECPPGMVRSTSDSLSSEEATEDDDDDETMSNSSSNSSCSDNDDYVSDEEETTVSSHSSSSSQQQYHAPSPPLVLPRGVTFNEQVRVLPIPPIEHYTPEQRYKMYANRFELRENKLRNKREFEFDNHDWRNATEEHSMAICPMSGDLMHPAHL